MNPRLSRYDVGVLEEGFDDGFCHRPGPRLSHDAADGGPAERGPRLQPVADRLFQPLEGLLPGGSTRRRSDAIDNGVMPTPLRHFLARIVPRNKVMFEPASENGLNS